MIFPNWQCKWKGQQWKKTEFQSVLSDNNKTNFPKTTKTIRDLHANPPNGTPQLTSPLYRYTDSTKLLVSQSKSNIFEQNLSAKMSDTSESAYILRKNTQILTP